MLFGFTNPIRKLTSIKVGSKKVQFPNKMNKLKWKAK